MIIVALQQNIIETVLDCRAFALCRLRSAQMECQMKKQRAECLIVSDPVVIFELWMEQILRALQTDRFGVAYNRLFFATGINRLRPR